MAVKNKKIGASGRFGAGYGKIKERLNAVEAKQRKRQSCPFCNGSAKRQAKGIWSCKKCGKTFAGGTFYLKN
jgi:large subunit ribosomal protein L37Ae